MAIKRVPELDATNKVRTIHLGGVGADATKFLRGDQTWAVPAGGGGSISSCSAYREIAVQTISPLTYTKITWDGTEWDDLGEMDLVNDKYIAIGAGKRVVTASIFWVSILESVFYRIAVYKNGVFFRHETRRPSAGTPMTNSINTIIDLLSGDYLEIFAYHNSSVDKNIGMNRISTYFQVQKI